MSQANTAPQKGAANTATNPMSMTKIIHIIIGMSIMLFVPYLNSPEFIVSYSEKLVGLGFPIVDEGILVSFTPMGMKVIGIFAGVIYLWTVVDTLWPSFIAVFLLGISGFAPMNNILTMYMGNPTVVYTFFILIYATIIARSQIASYLARFLITREFAKGKPWILTSLILFTSYSVALVATMASIFLMWAVLYSMFKECGYKKGDKFVNYMVVGIVFMAMLAFSTDAIKGGPFYFLSAINNMAQNPNMQVAPMSIPAFILMGIIVSLVSISLYLLFMRFIARVDVSLLHNFDIELLKSNPLPPMTWKQKLTVFFFLFLAGWFIIAALLPAGNFLDANKMGISILMTFIMTSVQVKGDKFLELPQIMNQFSWSTFFLIATAMLLGSALSSPQTNFSIVVEYTLRDFFHGFSYIELIIATVLIGTLLTNFTNSVVTGLIFAPILVTLSNAYGYNPLPLLAVFFFTVLMALCTPAASPYAALLFGNSEWVSKFDATKCAFIATILTIISLIIVGIPLARAFF